MAHLKPNVSRSTLGEVSSSLPPTSLYHPVLWIHFLHPLDPGWSQTETNQFCNKQGFQLATLSPIIIQILCDSNHQLSFKDCQVLGNKTVEFFIHLSSIRNDLLSFRCIQVCFLKQAIFKKQKTKASSYTTQLNRCKKGHIFSKTHSILQHSYQCLEKYIRCILIISTISRPIPPSYAPKFVFFPIF